MGYRSDYFYRHLALNDKKKLNLNILKMYNIGLTFLAFPTLDIMTFFFMSSMHSLIPVADAYNPFFPFFLFISLLISFHVYCLLHILSLLCYLSFLCLSRAIDTNCETTSTYMYYTCYIVMHWLFIILNEQQKYK